MFTSILSVLTLLLFAVSIKAGCQNGSIQWKSNCYLFNSEEDGFAKAEQNCVKNGGHLVSLHDAFTNDVIGQNAPDFFANNSVIDYWIGANSINTPYLWEWTDESNLDFIDWQIGEPSNNSGLRCASASMNGGYWTAQDCFSRKPFVCAIKMIEIPSTFPTTPIQTVPTTPAFSPQGNCTTGWKYFNLTNSYYCDLPSKVLKWQDGENYCFNTLGSAHLISIHSDAENTFITNFILADNSVVWTGLFSRDDGGTWQWSDGTPTDYLNWYIGEPIASNGNCVVMGNTGFSNAFVFQQDDCADKSHIICKVLAL